MKKHDYKIKVEWTGNEGTGTSSYKSYKRDHVISADGKYDKVNGSSDPVFLGDKTRYNPEDLFLSSLASCHMLWYLHLCSEHKICVTEYVDNATGIMEEIEDGSGKFVAVTLNPSVKITEKKLISKANELHETAGKMCFIANSCNFKIGYLPKTISE